MIMRSLSVFEVKRDSGCHGNHVSMVTTVPMVTTVAMVTMAAMVTKVSLREWGVKGQKPQKVPLDTKGCLSTKFSDNRSKGLARRARTDGQTDRRTDTLHKTTTSLNFVLAT